MGRRQRPAWRSGVGLWVVADSGCGGRKRFLGDGTAEDDEPTWLHFWGPADLNCHKARAYLMLGEPKDAERAASAARIDCDEAMYPRNHTIYSAVRARALIEDGKVDEAIAAATPVVARVSTLGSRRIATEARTTVRLLEKRRNYAPATSFATWATTLLPAT